MTAGARTLRIVVAVVFVTTLLAAVAVAWLRTEHPRPAPEEAGPDHAAAAASPALVALVPPSRSHFRADDL